MWFEGFVVGIVVGGVVMNYLKSREIAQLEQTILVKNKLNLHY